MTQNVKPLDQLDRHILMTLVENARISNVELAETIGLSASQCWQRVRRLEKDRFIESYTSRLDQAKLGVGEIVIVEVTLDRHEDEILEQFGKEMASIPEVLEVYLTTGEYDYLLKVAVSGTRGYEEFLRKKLYRVKGIRHSRSSFTLRCLKQVQAFVPIGQ